MGLARKQKDVYIEEKVEKKAADLIQQRGASELASAYSSKFRIVEISAILVFFALGGLLVYRLSLQASAWWPLYIGTFLLGMVSADFVSGLVHWGADSWGTPEWPIVGNAFIRPFREHHVDAKSITRHDFIETNGANCLVSIPILAATLLIPTASANPWALFFSSLFTSLTWWVFLTNQIHKWSHQDECPPVVAWFQAKGIILSPKHHALHHCPPFENYFSITTGWVNEPLRKIGFYRRLEHWIHSTTGAVPRQDDIGAKAAEKVMARAEIAEGSDSNSARQLT